MLIYDIIYHISGLKLKPIGWRRKAAAAEEAEVARKRTKAQELLKAIKKKEKKDKEDKEGKEQCDLWFGIRDLQHTTGYTTSQISWIGVKAGMGP
ncbi:pro-apoptotic serine protease nma111 [Aspergillus lentulus]|uniref:pro-apoptotic serine protease nma111 n=1 Tax=Aspergillus lentulus TaxID=293939 RepID=UPI00139263A6|nr:pro-apoptotic serine protease nma111 [Aspergillus lentulus]GFF44044.1 pro-apoptotic serine protease nma111 [Aspergillus lentulus]GFF90500.1 pro-apoptotic serine protease nma111 [Aspergillus lentulus]